MAAIPFLDNLGQFLSSQAMPVYLGTLIVFIVLETVISGHEAKSETGVGRYIVNFGFPIVTSLFLALFPIGIASAALFAAEAGYGLFNQVHAGPGMILLAGLLVRTFLAYWIHRAFHQLPLLWRLHRTHHNDPVLDVSSGLRHHPAEILPAIPIYMCGTIALGLPLWAALLIEALIVAGSFWKHANITMPPRLAKLLGTVFATPEIHLLHHSAKRVETDSNYGNLLIIWDRLFGTFTPPKEFNELRIGLGDSDDQIAGNFWKQLLLPFRPQL